jgi:hypothetical protein
VLLTCNLDRPLKTALRFRGLRIILLKQQLALKPVRLRLLKVEVIHEVHRSFDAGEQRWDRPSLAFER